MTSHHQKQNVKKKCVLMDIIMIYDPINCLQLTTTYYQNCNICEREGNWYNMYYTTCKLGYNLDPGNNCKCAKRFYKENVNINV